MIMKKACIFFLCFFLAFLPFVAVAAEYTVGDGDVLDIKVYENDDLATTVRVTANDTIRVSLIGEVDVSNLTVSEVASRIETLLADGYLVNPQVDVFVKEYRSKKVIILGQVNRPGLFELQGKTTLLEFISKAGGLTSDVGSTATIKRKSVETGEDDNIEIDLNRLIKKGDTSLNVSIRDGDSVYISKADVYYVSGEVNKPGDYKLEDDITIIKAITTAGGFTKIAAEGKVKVNRVIDGQQLVLENVKMDMPVLPDDVIIVPESFF
jgi:polysaccharide export outer membrane protein